MKKKFIIFLTVVLIIAVGIYFYKVSTRIYGNDTKSIKAIISKQQKINDEVNVFDLVDIDEFRITGYFEGDSEFGGKMGYAVFKANGNGDYVFQSLYPGVAEASSGDKISYDAGYPYQR